jgi:phosphomannomutase/phosphoglucomutase
MSIYKECDIRGLYEDELREDDATAIGKAIGTILGGTEVVVGGDTRFSTESLKTALIIGLTSTGCSVTDIGTVPTPVFYFARSFLGTAGGVMVTASHNPVGYNGFKIVLEDAPIEPRHIQRIEELVSSGRFSAGEGRYRRQSVTDEYHRMIRELVDTTRELHLVVDCGNGAASEVAPAALRAQGHRVDCLYCRYEKDFPNRNPNPSKEEHLSDLKSEVLARGADLGVAFDGDGDRVVFVDNAGRYLEGESTFVLLTRHYLEHSKAGARVVYDGKSSSVVEQAILEGGGVPVRERSGHAFIKKRFLDEGAVLAGEVSGHFFFHEIGHDDGIFAAVKMTEILSRDSRTLAEIVDTTIERRLITPDVRIAMEPESVDTVLAHVERVGTRHELSRLDGVRIDFADGWIMVRRSVTEPCITVRLEADTMDAADAISSEVFVGLDESIHREVMASFKVDTVSKVLH